MAPEQLIETWSFLYERVNKKPAPEMIYARGWFKIPSQFAVMRRADLESAIGRLEMLTTPKETSNV